MNELQLTPSGLNFLLSSIDNPVKVCKKIIETIKKEKCNQFIIDKEDIKNFLKRLEETQKEIKVSKKEISVPDVNVIMDSSKYYDKIAGNINGFLMYFRDRYKKIRKILEERIDASGVIDIKDLNNANKYENVKICGMVTEKRESKMGSLIIEIEDLSGRVLGIFTENSKKKVFIRDHLLMDQVLLFQGKYSNGFFKINDIFWPDIPHTNKPQDSITKQEREDINIVLLSDIHVGSKEFLKEKFQKFIDWLSLRFGTKKQRDLASKVKYIILGGDIVDGIGAYPGQEKDLEISDIFEQYEMFYELIKGAPDWLRFIMIPGNHDAVRQALPQPAIPKKFCEACYKDKRFLMLGNPSLIEIEGINILTYHGQSFNDLIPLIPEASMENPNPAMKEMLRGRHLAPVWGGKTQIAPIKEDCLVIDQIPTILHTGHIHYNSYDIYKGVYIINSGTFQKQTEYQKMMGMVPTPAIVTIFNIKSLKINQLDFNY